MIQIKISMILTDLERQKKTITNRIESKRIFIIFGFVFTYFKVFIKQNLCLLTFEFILVLNIIYFILS